MHLECTPIELGITPSSPFQDHPKSRLSLAGSDPLSRHDRVSMTSHGDAGATFPAGATRRRGHQREAQSLTGSYSFHCMIIRPLRHTNFLAEINARAAVVVGSSYLWFVIFCGLFVCFLALLLAFLCGLGPVLRRSGSVRRLLASLIPFGCMANLSLLWRVVL